MKKKIIGLIFVISFVLTGCSNGVEEKVVFYSNADDDAVEIIEATLDENGFKGMYEIQTFGSSETYAKLDSEGASTNADVVLLSNFYLNDLASNNEDMFVPVEVDNSSLNEQFVDEMFYPMIANRGVLFYNTAELKELGLNAPTSIKDLTEPQYSGKISLPDMNQSTTGWLMVQSVIDGYDDNISKEIFKGLKLNAGNHLESSGSSPSKKVNVGEVVIGYGLKHLVVDNDKLTIVEPIEGSYAIVDSYGVINGDQQELAQEMVAVLASEAKAKLLEIYPIDYESDELSDVKFFDPKLSYELLTEHKNLWNGE